MTDKMLKTYKRWVHKQRRNETVETTRAFIIEEAKFQMAPAETIHGFQKVNVSCQKNAGSNCFIQMQITKKTRKTKCAVCKHDHRIWQYNTFKEEDINRRWETAKKQKLYF